MNQSGQWIDPGSWNCISQENGYLLRSRVGAGVDVLRDFLETVAVAVGVAAAHRTAEIELHPIGSKRLLETFGKALFSTERETSNRKKQTISTVSNRWREKGAVNNLDLWGNYPELVGKIIFINGFLVPPAETPLLRHVGWTMFQLACVWESLAIFQPWNSILFHLLMKWKVLLHRKDRVSPNPAIGCVWSVEIS